MEPTNAREESRRGEATCDKSTRSKRDSCGGRHGVHPIPTARAMAFLRHVTGLWTPSSAIALFWVVGLACCTLKTKSQLSTKGRERNRRDRQTAKSSTASIILLFSFCYFVQQQPSLSSISHSSMYARARPYIHLIVRPVKVCFNSLCACDYTLVVI
jgi:hypothetical protein